MNRSLTSILGIIALILVIVAALYFIRDEADDSAVDIEIGLVQDAPAPSFELPVRPIGATLRG